MEQHCKHANLTISNNGNVGISGVQIRNKNIHFGLDRIGKVVS
jgi:hypothetical protein